MGPKDSIGYYTRDFHETIRDAKCQRGSDYASVSI